MRVAVELECDVVAERLGGVELINDRLLLRNHRSIGARPETDKPSNFNGFTG